MQNLESLYDFDPSDPFYEEIDFNPFKYRSTLTSGFFLNGVKNNLSNYTIDQLVKIYGWLDSLYVGHKKHFIDLPNRSVPLLKETKDSIGKKFIHEYAGGLVIEVKKLNWIDVLSH